MTDQPASPKTPTPLQASMRQALENKRNAGAVPAGVKDGRKEAERAARARSQSKSKPWMTR